MVPIAPAINIEVQNGEPITLSPTDVDDEPIPAGATASLTAPLRLDAPVGWQPSADQEGVPVHTSPSAPGSGSEHQEGEVQEGGG